jgi:hypothetical protein
MAPDHPPPTHQRAHGMRVEADGPLPLARPGDGTTRMPIPFTQPKGTVMRARHRHFLAVLLTAIAVATAVPAGPVSSQADGPHYCPAGTNWDNRIQRCV